MNKKKIFNDPIYGLIMFEHEILYEIIDHPYFQRLRRITQQALSHYVYPGAMHTRFQHALGALHLMTRALNVIQSKGIQISREESEATCIAILLHDLGHGPYSHALEHTILDLSHEKISLALIKAIGKDLGHDFTLVESIFSGVYHRPFLHQLVSSQLDIDRLDYLTRDSFFSGVAEGIIGYDRLISMMNVVDDSLVIEEKGIYSVEKFLIARRLMYHQVYLHKTVVSAECMLVSILKRAQWLVINGQPLEASYSLTRLLETSASESSIAQNEGLMQLYTEIDDIDVMAMIKSGIKNTDRVLQFLCKNLLERKLFKLYLQSDNVYKQESMELCLPKTKSNHWKNDELAYLLLEKIELFKYYELGKESIMILCKNGSVLPYDKMTNAAIYPDIEEIKFNFVPINL